MRKPMMAGNQCVYGASCRNPCRSMPLDQDARLVMRVYHRTGCQRGATKVASTPENGEAIVLLCVADRDGNTWLRGESVLYAPARWQDDFEVFVVDVDLSTWA